MPLLPAVECLSRRLPGRRAFVTGAASGLGRALATALARDGWHLGLVDLTDERLAPVATELRALGAEVHSFAGDVADAAFVASAVEGFAKSVGGLDLIVNNAGVAVAGAAEEIPLADWRWAIDVNLLGVVHGCRAAVPLMRRQGSGVIVNIASSAGFAAAPQMAAYNVTKAGVISLSETLAAELGSSGIQVTVAMPGFFRTGLLSTLRAPAAETAYARQLLERARHGPDAAAAAVLTAAANGRLHLVWPREYAVLWRLKRWFPRWFVGRVRRLRELQIRRAADRPRV